MTWKIVTPIAARNYVLNPSAETTGNFVQFGGATVTREQGVSAWGEYSYKIVPGGVDRGIGLTSQEPAPAIPLQVFFAARDVTGALAVTIDDGGIAIPVQPLGNGWVLYHITRTTDFSGSGVVITNSTNETWYLDGVVYTDGSRIQTYLDGDQPGCRWTSTPHGSASTRPANTRAGGAIYDWQTDLGFYIERISGDMTRPLNIISERPFRAGGSVDMTRIGARTLILVGSLITSGLLPLHAQHVALTDALRPDAVPLATDGRPQPLLLQYWGTEKVLQLRAHYAGGLDEMEDARDCGSQQYPLTFDIAQPYWEEVVERSLVVTTQRTQAVRAVLGRVNGEWDPLGPPASIGGARTFGVLSFAESPRYVYVAGDFTDFDAVGNDRIARYDRLAGTWDVPYTIAPSINAVIRKIFFLPDGRLVIGGDIASIDGVNIDGAGIYDPVADTWAMLGDGFSTFSGTNVYDLAFDIHTGDIYAVGLTQQLYRLPFGYTNWEASGDPTGGLLLSKLAFARPGQPGTAVWLYGGGPNGLARFNVAETGSGGTWETVTGPAEVNAIVATPKEIVTGGVDTTALGVISNPAAASPVWFLAARVPAGSRIFALAAEEFSQWIYIGGDFEGLLPVFGPSIKARAIARYNLLGFVYAMPVDLPLEPPFTLTSYAIGTGETPLFGERQTNLYIGFNTAGNATLPGDIVTLTTNVPGGAESKPLLRLTREGGLSATVVSVRNITTGDEILLSAAMNDGETLLIDLVNLTVRRDYGGGNSDAIQPLPGSRFASFALLPTGNRLEVRIINDGAVISGVLRYTQRHHGYRSANVAE